MPKCTPLAEQTIVPALMRDGDAAKYIGVSTRQLWKMAATGAAPAPLKLPHARSTRWRRTDLDEWVGGLK